MYAKSQHICTARFNRLMVFSGIRELYSYNITEFYCYVTELYPYVT